MGVEQLRLEVLWNAVQPSLLRHNVITWDCALNVIFRSFLNFLISKAPVSCNFNLLVLLVYTLVSLQIVSIFRLLLKFCWFFFVKVFTICCL